MNLRTNPIPEELILEVIEYASSKNKWEHNKFIKNYNVVMHQLPKPLRFSKHTHLRNKHILINILRVWTQE